MKRIIFNICLCFLCLILISSCTDNSIKSEYKLYGLVNEQTYFLNESYNPLDGIVAKDSAGNDVTNNLTYFGNIPLVDGKLSKEGTYQFEILLIINDVEVLKENVVLIVLNYEELIDTIKPEIVVEDEYYFEVGEEFDIEFVATDNIDKDISSKIKITGLDALLLENNSFTKSGVYELILEVTDSALNTATKKILINVLPRTMYPEVNRYDLEINEFKGITDQSRLNDYHLVWADEFNVDGYPSSAIWTPEIGNGSWGWGNNEKQYYTNSINNAKVSNGVLSITAIKENIGGFNYSSARLKTAKKVDFKYGYLEASIKLPSTGGAWPAFWLMPTNSVYGSWPSSGEIDIMEYQSNNHDYYFGTAHTQNNHGSGITSGRLKGEGLETSFHKYALEWTPDYIKWYFDDVLYHTYTNPKRPIDNQNDWPFDQEFYFILNVAVGGTLGGTIANDFKTATMEVDYVRIYQCDYTKSDNEKPSVLNINTSTLSNSISINWDEAFDNVGIHHYEVILDGEHIASTINLNYVIENLVSKQTYYIQVLAVDLAGNYSKSKEVEVTLK